MNSQRLPAILFASVLLSACVPLTTYRTEIPELTSASTEPGSKPKYFECAVDDKIVSANRARCEDEKYAAAAPDPQSAGSQAIQHRFYQTQDGQQGDYYLSFIEFDDQGWFSERRQMEALFALLKDLEKKDKKTNGHTLIQVFAHGWMHNASACDNNVVCFSRLLERTDLTEKQVQVMKWMLKDVPQGLGATSIESAMISLGRLIEFSEKPAEVQKKELDAIEKPRTVVGVYLGWRGRPFDTVLNNLSFWSRKDTAARVGSGGVYELLTRLKDYRDIRQKGEAADINKTQLVITGHSFGGLVIYSALSHALMEQAAKTILVKKSDSDPDPAIQYGIARSFGDFVLLVNPAFEGSLYEPLFNIASNRCYKPTQRPVMMIVTSKADNATGFAFPIGRALDTLFQHATSSEQGDSMRKTVGHNLRYTTHNLTWKPDDKTSGEGKLSDEPIDKSDCGCPHLLPTSSLMLKTIQEGSINAFLGDNYGDGLDLAAVTSTQYAANYPYPVVSTDAGVIADHNAIYNDKFITFAQQFFLKHITFKRPFQPSSSSKERPSDETLPVSLTPFESCRFEDRRASAR